METLDLFDHNPPTVDVISEPVSVPKKPPVATKADDKTIPNILLYAHDNATNFWKGWKHRRDCLMQIRRFANWMDIGAIPMSQITDSHMVDYRDYLASTGMANGTVNRHLSGISSCLTKAVEKKVLTSAPRCKYLSESKGRPRSFSSDEVWHITNYFIKAGEEWLADMVIVGCNTGMRKSEIIALADDDVIIATDYSSVWLPKRLTKTKEGRKVMLNEKAKKAVQRLVKTIKASYTHDIFYDRWWGCKEALGYRHDDTFVFHVTRHTAATNMANKSVNSKTIATILGHRNEKTTAQYMHPSDDAMSDAVNVI